MVSYQHNPPEWATGPGNMEQDHQHYQIVMPNGMGSMSLASLPPGAIPVGQLPPGPIPPGHQPPLMQICHEVKAVSFSTSSLTLALSCCAYRLIAETESGTTRLSGAPFPDAAQAYHHDEKNHSREYACSARQNKRKYTRWQSDSTPLKLRRTGFKIAGQRSNRSSRRR
jgi:hypothetical protein